MHGNFVAAKQDGSIRWHEARDALGGLDLIVITDASFGQPHEHRKLVLALAAVTSAVNCSVLVSVGELPAAQADLAEVILETTSDGAGGVLTLAKAVEGSGWSRRYELGRVRLGTVEASVASPGRLVEFTPSWREAAPVPPPTPKPLTPIVSRLVYPVVGFDISAEEKARWPDHGWVFTPAEAVAAVEGTKNLGRTEIAVAFDQRGGFGMPEIGRIETALLAAGLAKFAVVIASEQRLLAAA